MADRRPGRPSNDPAIDMGGRRKDDVAEFELEVSMTTTIGPLASSARRRSGRNGVLSRSRRSRGPSSTEMVARESPISNSNAMNSGRQSTGTAWSFPTPRRSSRNFEAAGEMESIVSAAARCEALRPVRGAGERGLFFLCVASNPTYGPPEMPMKVVSLLRVERARTRPPNGDTDGVECTISIKRSCNSLSLVSTPGVGQATTSIAVARAGFV
jgi:hypothetical protein